MLNNRIKKCIVSPIKAIALVGCLFGSLASNTVFAINPQHYVLPVEENVEKLINDVKASYNPVVEQIVVSFKLSKQSQVNIKLMDALGNEVLALFSGSMEEGSQNHIFDTNEKVSPGFYFLRVSSGAETIVKRISIK